MHGYLLALMKLVGYPSDSLVDFEVSTAILQRADFRRGAK